MIEEVESLLPKLELARLAHPEVLEERQVAVVVPGAVDVRDHIVAVMSRRRRLEACGIKDLLRAQVIRRTAHQQRHRGLIRCPINVTPAQLGDATEVTGAQHADGNRTGKTGTYHKHRGATVEISIPAHLPSVQQSIRGRVVPQILLTEGGQSDSVGA